MHAHHGPQNALQLIDDLEILVLKPMLTNKVRKFGEMAFVFQDFASQRSLGHLTIKVRGHGTIEHPTKVDLA